MHFSSLDDALKWAVGAIIQNGERAAPRSIPTLELRSVLIAIDDPRRRYVSLEPRRWSFSYALGELSWHLRASTDLQEIAFYSKRWRAMSDDGAKITGSAYGAKVFQRTGSRNQWEHVRDTLQSDPATRRAVLILADSAGDCLQTGRDVSCATSLQFVVRHGKLDAIVSMRSNDVILGFPYDVFLFSMLQELMATELGVEIGAYHHFTTSLHLYESNIPNARRLLASSSRLSEPMPPMKQLEQLSEFLAGEQCTREGKQLSRDIHEGYWHELLDVLVYRNGSRYGAHHDIDKVISNPLYRQLTKLSEATREPHEVADWVSIERARRSYPHES
jgi:thymidylate synthase